MTTIAHVLGMADTTSTSLIVDINKNTSIPTFILTNTVRFVVFGDILALNILMEVLGWLTDMVGGADVHVTGLTLHEATVDRCLAVIVVLYRLVAHTRTSLTKVVDIAGLVLTTRATFLPLASATTPSPFVRDGGGSASATGLSLAATRTSRAASFHSPSFAVPHHVLLCERLLIHL